MYPLVTCLGESSPKRPFSWYILLVLNTLFLRELRWVPKGVPVLLGCQLHGQMINGVARHWRFLHCTEICNCNTAMESYDPIDFNCILVIDCKISNDSNPSMIIPKIHYCIIPHNGEWIAVMPCACLLAFRTLEADFSSICKSFALMFHNPPIREQEITAVSHRTDFEGFFALIVSTVPANWEGITPSAILHSISCNLLNFLVLLVSNKWNIVFFNRFLSVTRFGSSRIEQPLCWNVLFA